MESNLVQILWEKEEEKKIEGAQNFIYELETKVVDDEEYLCILIGILAELKRS